MRTLGICWTAYGVFRLCMGVAAVVLSPVATVMFGALLTRVADPFTWMTAFHSVYVGWVALSFVCGMLGILGGLSLLRSPSGVRSLLVTASFLSLSDLPVGIAISVYTLVVLLHAPARAEPIEAREARQVRADIS